jgi:hypothetical protein
MEYLLPDTKTLRQARLVCRDWCISASQALKRETRVRVGEHCTNVSKLAEFLFLVQSHGTQIATVTNFTLCQDVFQSQNETVVRGFFQLLHTFVESITFLFDLKSNMDLGEMSFIFHKDFQKDDTYFPKLKYIEWDDRRSHNKMLGRFKESGSKLLQWLLQRSPSLHYLSIHFERARHRQRPEVHPEVDEATVFMSKLFHLENRSFPRNLRTLQLDVNLTDSLFLVLRDFFIANPIRLSSLTLCIRESHFLSEKFANFLTPFKDCLKELRIMSLSDKSHCNFQFPESMRQLKLLEISGWNISSGNVSFERFSYSKNLPSLQTLLLDCWTEKQSWWQFFPLGSCGHNCTLETVQELRLPEELATRQTLEHIVKLIPNLRKLDIPISYEEIAALEIVFDNWTDLTELTIRKNSNSWKANKAVADNIFTGIPKDVCNAILKCKRLELKTFPVLDNILKQVRTGPGLTQLTSMTATILFLARWLTNINKKYY